MSSALVTGASGFIGRHCLPLLVDAGFEVHAVSSRASSGPGPAAVCWHQADLLDTKQARALVDRLRPSHLLHLAWYAVPGKYWTAPENTAWLNASMELLRAFSAAGGRRFVVAGSCAEYDWNHGESRGVCNEATTPLAPATPYGAAKHALHAGLSSLSSGSSGLSGAWGRIFFLYGPHEQRERLVPSVIRALLAGKPALCTHGEQLRDFLHVADVADAFVSLLESTATGAFNIGSGTPVAIRDIAHLIGAKLNSTGLLRLGALPSRDGDPPLLVADVGRLRRALGWQPRFSLDRGLDHAIEWWKLEMAGRVGQT
jgi:nucleoside-diphosphate-sugar epimerase